MEVEKQFFKVNGDYEASIFHFRTKNGVPISKEKIPVCCGVDGNVVYCSNKNCCLRNGCGFA